jgi:hypothetical protein
MSLATRKVDERSRVVLPEAFAGRVVVIESVSVDEVRIKIKKEPRRRPSMKDLVPLITDQNRHDLIDFGPSVGAEAL